jgi:hypothetical protein
MAWLPFRRRNSAATLALEARKLEQGGRGAVKPPMNYGKKMAVARPPLRALSHRV